MERREVLRRRRMGTAGTDGGPSVISVLSIQLDSRGLCVSPFSRLHCIWGLLLLVSGRALDGSSLSRYSSYDIPMATVIGIFHQLPSSPIDA